MKFKALRMALAAGFLMTSSMVVAVTLVERALLSTASVGAQDAGKGTHFNG